MDERYFNINIERAVLSTFVFEPESYFKLDKLPKKGLFYHPFHQELLDAIVWLHEHGKPVEEEFVKTRLMGREAFDEVAFLEVLSTTPISNLEQYLEELRLYSLRRELANFAIDVKKAVEEVPEGRALVDRVEKGLLKIASDDEEGGAAEISQALGEAMAHIEAMEKRGDGLVGVDTGFSALNAKTGGFAKGDLVILAARPSMGKTSLALKMVLETAKRGNGVMFFSLEMPREQLAMRLLSAESGVPLENIRYGRLDERQKRAIEQGRAQLSRLRIVIDDTGCVSIGQIRTKLRRELMKKRKIDLVVVDYLQLMGEGVAKERHLQIAEISRGLKLLARELELPVVALSQLNRQLEGRADKRPMLSDLRESGSIEQDADLILFVYREDVYKMQEEKQKEKEMRAKGMEYKAVIQERPISETELIIGKQRNGPLGTIRLEFVKATATFREPREYVVEI